MDIISYLIKDSSNAHEMYQSKNLDWAVKSLEHNSRNNIVHFITNYNHSLFNINQNVKLYSYDDFISDAIVEFDSTYIHLSTNYHMFEKNSIMGYLMMNSFCHKTGITRFMHLEPDVLVFSKNLEIDFSYFPAHRYGLTLLNQLGAGGSFFDLNIINSLQLFNDGVLASYSPDKTKTPKMFNMEKELIYYQESVDKKLGRGGVSDMHFWNYIYNTNKDKVYGNMEIPINNVIYHCCRVNHHNMDLICDDNNFLKLTVGDNECAGVNSIGQSIKIKLLHFPGHLKRYIVDFI